MKLDRHVTACAAVVAVCLAMSLPTVSRDSYSSPMILGSYLSSPIHSFHVREGFRRRRMADSIRHHVERWPI